MDRRDADRPKGKGVLMAIDENTRDYLKGVARRLDGAERGGRSAIVKAAAEHLGWTVATVYRNLRSHVGWSSERKARVDRGSTRQPEIGIRMTSGLVREATRKNGKRTMATGTAMSVAAQNAVPITVSTSQMNRLLRARKINGKQTAMPAPAITLRSLHPNHVHQVDASLCVVYYLKGEQHIIRDDQFYRNKLDKIARMDFKVWRYVLTDHASGTVIPWYGQGKGEAPELVFETLMHAWSHQPPRAFHGVPKILYWDKGSANQAAMVKNLLRALEVESITHAPGNPRAKGQVECANNLVERAFESRLRFEPVANVAELNAAANHWAVAWNANGLPRSDSRLRRPGIDPIARTDLWLTIKPEQLRELPPIEACRALLRGADVTRKVRNLQISFRHPRAERSLVYDLRGLAGICDGDTVAVSPLLFGNRRVVVSIERYDGEALEYSVEPVTDYDRFGFTGSAPIIGEEHKAMPDSDAERNRKELDRLAYPDTPLDEIKKVRDKGTTPFLRDGKPLDAISHLAAIDLPTPLPKRGDAISLATPGHVRLEAIKLSVTEACKRLRPLLGAGWQPEFYNQIKTDFPQGVPEDELDAIAERLGSGEAPARKTALAIVK